MHTTMPGHVCGTPRGAMLSPHLNMCMARSSLPSTEEMRNMMTEAGALALLIGFMPGTSGALISTRPGSARVEESEGQRG